MVDIHTHLFNLKYLPVQGILTRFTNGIVPDIITNPVANVLIRHTRSDFETALAAVQGMTLHERIYGVKHTFKAAAITKLNAIVAIDTIVDNFSADEIKEPELQEALLAFYAIIGDKAKAAESRMMFENIHQHALTKLNAHDFLSFSNGLKKMLHWIVSLIEKGEHFIRWVYIMQHSENELFSVLKQDVPGMKYYIHHMMDVDFYFNSKPSYFDFQTKQVANMQAINEKYKDNLIGFIAFDPNKKNGLDIVKDAIENKGFKGIKFYPPMGYRAINNIPALQQLDAVNSALFTYCVTNDIPIFSHCNNNGFEAYKHSGYNANPLYWQAVLAKKEFTNLRLNLAHGGGVQGWFSQVNKDDQVKLTDIDDNIMDSSDEQTTWNRSYAKIVYKLCLTYPNVYCDAAYLDEISDEKLLVNFTARLVNVFKTEPAFAQKIIFGTDWHMLFQEGENASFFVGYNKLFEAAGVLGPYRDDFFENNALRYLKMA